MADVLPHAVGELRGRSPGHPDRRRRPRLRRRRHWAAVLLRRRDRGGALAEGLHGRVRHERPGVGHRQRPARRRRPAPDRRRRRARRPGGGLRQADRRGALAGDRGRGRDRLRTADHLRGRRRPPAHRLASAGPRVAGPRDRRDLLGAALGRLDGDHGGDPGAERQLPAGFAVLQRLAHDAAEPGPSGRDGAVAGPQPQRAAGRDGHHPRDGDDPDHHRRPRLRRGQLRRAAGARRRHGRTSLDESGHDGPGTLEHRLPRAAPGPVLRQQRRGVPHARPVHAGGVRRARPHAAHRADRGLRHPNAARPHRRAPRQLVAPGLRERAHRPPQRPGDHPRVPAGGRNY